MRSAEKRALEHLAADRVGLRAEERSQNLVNRWHVWLLMARSQLNCAKQCVQRDQWERANLHRQRALELLEQIGLENLEVQPFDDEA